MPIGLGLVRIGNFLNGELYGRPTDGSWGFIFPTDPYGLTRHPSQLYEALFEGVILFILLMWIGKNTTKLGSLVALFSWDMESLDFLLSSLDSLMHTWDLLHYN